MAQQNKEHQKKLLTEIMEADQKNGLYDHIGDTNKKVTAVESFAKELIDEGFYIPKGIYDRAKQMEKQQHEQTWNAAHQAGRFEGKGIAEENWQTFKQYYNETYNK